MLLLFLWRFIEGIEDEEFKLYKHIFKRECICLDLEGFAYQLHLFFFRWNIFIILIKV